MHIFRQGPLSIFWGDKATCSVSKDSPDFKQFCVGFAQNLSLKNFVVLEQEHGVVGRVAHKDFSPGISVYEKIGDFLITNRPNVGIATLSADCLPVILYDAVHKAIGAAHSGWRGTVKNVAGVMLEAMVEAFNTNPEQVQVFFGPAARPCCYEVSADFEREIPLGFNKKNFLIKRDGKLFFDNALLCARMLERACVDVKKINQRFNICTMCNNQFYSARRDKGLERNITVVAVE